MCCEDRVYQSIYCTFLNIRKASSTAATLGGSNRRSISIPQICFFQQSPMFFNDIWLVMNCRATYREHLEDTFTFDAKTLAILSVTLVAFPTFLYNVMTKEFNKADDKAGR